MKSPRKFTNSRPSSSSSFWSRSSAPSRCRSLARAAARSSDGFVGRARTLVAGVSAALAFGCPAGAATPPIVAIPPQVLAPPALPASPVGSALAGAYGAIVRANVRDPFAAQRASFAYARALQQARLGNVAGALAAAAQARGDALSAAAPGVAPLVPLLPPAPSRFAVPPANAVPLVTDISLSPDLENARDEIARATASHANDRTLADARAHYRRALDAYVSGDAATSRVEARAAFDAAAREVRAPQ